MVSGICILDSGGYHVIIRRERERERAHYNMHTNVFCLVLIGLKDLSISIFNDCVLLLSKRAHTSLQISLADALSEVALRLAVVVTAPLLQALFFVSVG